MLLVSAALAILIGLNIAIRIRQTLTRIEMTHEDCVSLAMIDGLTGLLNRPGFDAVAAEVLEETRRLGTTSLRARVRYRCLSWPQ
jgi:GGDEF domain-containing protein